MQARVQSLYSTLRVSGLWLEIPILLSFNLLLVASGWLSINVPFSPVPITAQTFGVLLIAMVLGRTRATVIVAAYLAEGAAGLPVFAGGAAGAQVLVGPTAGYLFGFLLAAYVVGYLADRGWDRSYLLSIISMTLGTALIFLCGLTWLSRFVPFGVILATGLVPFLPGAVFKIFSAFAILPTIWRFVGHRE